MDQPLPPLAWCHHPSVGKGDSNPHGARPVHQITTMIKWFRISRLSIKNSLSLGHTLSGHQTPAVNYLDRFKSRQIPCRVNAENLLLPGKWLFWNRWIVHLVWMVGVFFFFNLFIDLR